MQATREASQALPHEQIIGEKHEQIWDDRRHKSVLRITVTVTECYHAISSIQFQYDDGEGRVHGNPQGGKKVFVLEKKEYITKMYATFNEVSGRVNYLKFETNLGKEFSVGNEPKLKTELKQVAEGKMIGFYGTADSTLSEIAAHMIKA